MAKPWHAAIGEHPILCLMCGNDTFRKREVLLNSTGMELFNMAWANESATGLICCVINIIGLYLPAPVVKREPNAFLAFVKKRDAGLDAHEETGREPVKTTV